MRAQPRKVQKQDSQNPMQYMGFSVTLLYSTIRTSLRADSLTEERHIHTVCPTMGM